MSIECGEQEPRAQVHQRLELAKPLLLGELALANSPYSGRNTACVLDAGDSLYGGHSIEFASGQSVSAEEMALGKIVSTHEQVQVVYVTGTGEGVRKAKHVMPTPEAYDLLASRLHPEAKMILLQPDDPDAFLIRGAGALRRAYEAKAFSVFNGTTAPVDDEILMNTILAPEDASLIHHLHLQGVAEGIHYYLTGSASGRGGASSCVNTWMTYRDMDLIAITKRPREEIEAEFEDIAGVWYGDLKKEPHDVKLWPSDEVREGVTYTGTCFMRGRPAEIDLFVAPSLQDATVRPEYINRNFFHQIS